MSYELVISYEFLIDNKISILNEMIHKQNVQFTNSAVINYNLRNILITVLKNKKLKY